ncbi:MAG: inorganic diphosphatase, partial [Bacteroidota bacterium]|nr:inorganic diphosphatase [Bacteroidota bacterium]
SIVKAQLIGVLKLLDGGEQDDKLIAVLDNSPFSGIHSIEELNQEFIGAAEIIQTWFVNYKGPGELESSGFGTKEEALKILDEAIQGYSGQ